MIYSISRLKPPPPPLTMYFFNIFVVVFFYFNVIVSGSPSITLNKRTITRTERSPITQFSSRAKSITNVPSSTKDEPTIMSIGRIDKKTSTSTITLVQMENPITGNILTTTATAETETKTDIDSSSSSSNLPSSAATSSTASKTNSTTTNRRITRNGTSENENNQAKPLKIIIPLLLICIAL